MGLMARDGELIVCDCDCTCMTGNRLGDHLLSLFWIDVPSLLVFTVVYQRENPSQPASQP